MTSELKNRWIWGLVAGALVLLTMFWLGPEASFLVATAAGLQGWREYCRLMNLSQERPSFLYLGYILIGAIFTHTFFVGAKTMFWLWIVWVVAFFTIFIEYAMERRRASIVNFDVQRSWTHLCRFILGVFYIFMLFGFIGPILSKIHGEQILLLGFVATFLADTCAYFVGKAYGRRKIWPDLSPGKTIEGAIGGWLGSFVASALLWLVFRFAFSSYPPLAPCLIVGLCAGPLSQAGDFMESLMKRVAGRKDSGTLLPGHGGILDRADGLVFMMPLVYFLF